MLVVSKWRLPGVPVDNIWMIVMSSWYRLIMRKHSIPPCEVVSKLSWWFVLSSCGYCRHMPHCDKLMWILPHCDKPMEWKHKHHFLEPDLGDLLTDEGCHHQTMITTSVGGIMEVMVVFIPVGSFQKYIFLILSKKFAMLTWFNHDAKHIILGWDKGEYLVVWHCDNSAGVLN